MFYQKDTINIGKSTIVRTLSEFPDGVSLGENKIENCVENMTGIAVEKKHHRTSCLEQCQDPFAIR